MRGFERNKIGPVDGSDHVGGNYAAALNLEANLPNLLPDDTRTDIILFLDFGNVWGVDYNSSLDNSKIRSSTGLAVDWLTPIGPLSFSTNCAADSAPYFTDFDFGFPLCWNQGTDGIEDVFEETIAPSFLDLKIFS